MMFDAATAPPAGTDLAPFLTIVICTHNRSHYLDRCLESLEAASRATIPSELVVVDSGSEPTEAERISALAHRHGALLLRQTRTGLSLARNAGLAVVRSKWVAYVDDDARVDAHWLEAIRAATERTPDSAAFGGVIRPLWEAPCPDWWPATLLGALTIMQWDKSGQVGSADLPRYVEPMGANMVFRSSALRDLGGFPLSLGRIGNKLLSGEEAWVVRALRNRGQPVHYDPTISVNHCIQAGRLTPQWILARQFWSGISEAVMCWRLGTRRAVLGKSLRMIIHLLVFSPLALMPRTSTRAIEPRCALAYAAGYLRGTLTGTR